MTFSLPSWVQVLQALLVPVIAIVGVWVAVHQMWIARIKLQHDLYERRYAVFEAIRRFLDETTAKIVVSPETMRSFTLYTADASFLFNEELAAYIDDVRRHALAAQTNHIVARSLEPGPKKAAASAAANKHQLWLTEQISLLSDKFRPSLRLYRRNKSREAWKRLCANMGRPRLQKQRWPD